MVRIRSRRYFVLIVISLVVVLLYRCLRSDTATSIKHGPVFLKKEPSWITLTTTLSNNTHVATLSNVETMTWKDCQMNPKLQTGNRLIDDYGLNDHNLAGENGRGIFFTGDEKILADKLTKKYNLNVHASDKTPINRQVPDSRFSGCKDRPFMQTLLTTSIIVPFYDEWPSVLLRTIYSIVNRSPWKWLHEIILVDDGSTLEELKQQLDEYLDGHFPKGLVKLIRLPERSGLIQARLKGFANATGDVVIFFDSHMEVNIDWLPPLLEVVARDRKSVAMSVLDYIQYESMEYKYYQDYMTRYGFDWRLVFFEAFFRVDQVGQTEEDTRPGTLMVGAAFAIDRQYFEEIGTYDERMKVWGGENLELSWRVWLCGGRLVHVPCSHIGHVARAQPYSFPKGRAEIEQFNYKRAIEVWMEPHHKELVYNYYPRMKAMDVGDLSTRLALKKRLQCKPFSWFLENVWPELFVMNEKVRAWGPARNMDTPRCLDNNQYMLQAAAPLYTKICHSSYITQGFSITNEGLLRTSLQCVKLTNNSVDERPVLEDCLMGDSQTWTHQQGGVIKHNSTGLCLDIESGAPIMKACNSSVKTQFWQFNTYV